MGDVDAVHLIGTGQTHAIALESIARLPAKTVGVDKQEIESRTNDTYHAYGEEVTKPSGSFLRLLLPFPLGGFLGRFTLCHF